MFIDVLRHELLFFTQICLFFLYKRRYQHVFCRLNAVTVMLFVLFQVRKGLFYGSFFFSRARICG